MADTLTRDGISGPVFAEALGVADTTVCRWAVQLGYRPIGSGNRRYFTCTDLMICRAWKAIGGEHGQGASPSHRQLCTVAADAIRRRPARYLVLTVDHGFTVDDWETAVELAAIVGRPRMRWLIDLWSRTDG